jgi:transcriptional regulator with XRE-family HTH domain
MKISNTKLPQLNRALRLVRVYHDLTQAELARRLGSSKSYISEIESGHKKVGFDLLEKYSAEFKIPVSSLLIFSEHAGKSEKSPDLRSYIADKTLKMLDWIATITAGDEVDEKPSTGRL